MMSRTAKVRVYIYTCADLRSNVRDNVEIMRQITAFGFAEELGEFGRVREDSRFRRSGAAWIIFVIYTII